MKQWTSKEIVYLKEHALLAETNEVLNSKEMAKKLGRSDSSVRNKIYYLQRNGDLPKVSLEQSFDSHKRPYSKEENKRIIAMKKQGASNNEIAEALGRTVKSIGSKVSRLNKEGKISLARQKWSEQDIQILLDKVTFDENGFVNNYDELAKLTHRRVEMIQAKISRLRKSGQLKVLPKEGTTNVKSKEAMNQFNNRRFAHKKGDENHMNEDLKVLVKSQEVTLIFTTIVINGQEIQQYFSKDGQLIVQKKTPLAGEVNK